MALTFTDADLEKVGSLQAALTGTLLRANAQKLEAGLAVFALLRCARILLDRYDENTQRMLVEQVCVPFLRHEPFTDDRMAH